MKTYIFFLLLAVAANASTLSTSALDGTSSALVMANIDHSATTNYGQDKRLLRVNKRKAETSDEERMESPPRETLDLLSKIGADPALNEEKRAKVKQIADAIKKWRDEVKTEAAVEEANVLNAQLKAKLREVAMDSEGGPVVEFYGGSLEDMMSVVVPKPMTEMIDKWGLATSVIEEREEKLNNYPQIFEILQDKKRMKNMAVGSVYFEKFGRNKGKRKASTSGKKSEAVEKYLRSLLQANENVFQRIGVTKSQVSDLALNMFHDETDLPKIPVIVDMAMGSEFFRVLSQRR